MNNVEQDLPLSEWGGQLAGAVSGIFLRKFPNLEMPSEEVAAIVDQFLSAPPADVPLNWTRAFPSLWTSRAADLERDLL